MLTRDADALLEHRLLAGRPNFPRHRAKTLDRLAIGYLTDVLPGAAAYTNLFYEGAELDGLVLFDDIAVVIEGKAGGMSVPARRGDVRRLREDIQRNVEDAWRQAARARVYLLRDEDSIFRNEDGEVVLRVRAGSVRDVVIVNPTLGSARHGRRWGRGGSPSRPRRAARPRSHEGRVWLPSRHGRRDLGSRLPSHQEWNG
jgi:hypothetical protein